LGERTGKVPGEKKIQENNPEDLKGVLRKENQGDIEG
jgi:hypothetical protein